MSKEMIEDIFEETKDIYNRNNENSSKIDSKLVQLFTFITALVLLFINIIKFPESCFLKSIYVLVGALFIISLVLIILAYKPMPYLAIEPNNLINKYCKRQYKSRKSLIEAMAGTTAENVISLKQNINKKSRIIEICAFFSVVALILIIILKVMEGV
jgi:hypothetical protein